MPHLICPQGHRWELAGAVTLVLDGQVRCPACGSVLEPTAVESLGTSSTTLTYHSRPTRTSPPQESSEPEKSPEPGVESQEPEKSPEPGVESQEPEKEPDSPPALDSSGDSLVSLAALEPGMGITLTMISASPVNVPGYEVLGELGRGGMGVVYKARHRMLKRLVALKMILAGSHASDNERTRFRTEAEAVARFQHPNIVQIYDIGEFDGLPFLSLEFVDGDSLARKLTGAPVPVPKALELVETLARAMHFAHEQGIVHRDLKPGNVLLMSDGTPKITDFGLAKQIDGASRQTQTGAILGTPSYIAPEQAAGRTREVGPATDVYALGAILYELLTGKPPFQADNPMKTLRQVLEQEPVRPSLLNPNVDTGLEAICLKCLEKVPAERYASAEALANELAAYGRGESILAEGRSGWRLLRMIFRETRHTDVMTQWGWVFMCHALQVFLISVLVAWMRWEGLKELQPWLYRGITLAACATLFVPVWFYRFRSRTPLTLLEKQLAQVWLIVTVAGALTVAIKWLIGPEWRMTPVAVLELGIGCGCTAVILGGSFYFLAVVCAAAALLLAGEPYLTHYLHRYLDADIELASFLPLIFGIAFAVALFIPGWKYSRMELEDTGEAPGE